MSFIVIMDSQETKDLQISLNATLSALSLHKDLGIPDDASSMTSSFTTISSVGSRNSPAPLTSQNTAIPLHLAHWSQYATSSVLSPNGERLKALKIFESFVDIVTQHSLEETPCVTILEEAIAICENRDRKLSREGKKSSKKLEAPPLHIPLLFKTSSFAKSISSTF